MDNRYTGNKTNSSERINCNQSASAAIQTVTAKPQKKRSKIANYFYNLFHYNTGSAPRVWELDMFRGLLILFVTLDHVVSFGFEFGIFNFKTPEMLWFVEHVLRAYQVSSFRKGIQPFGLFAFCLLSGISCSLSRSSIKRVLKMVVFCAAFMGAFALLHIIVPNAVGHYFIFNIINVLTICVIVWFIFDLIKLPHWARTVIGLVIVCIGISYYYEFFVLNTANIENDLLSLLVYNHHGCGIVTNFEPLFPHMGFFILGGVVGKAVYSDKKTRTKSEVPIKPLIPLALVGKNSLFNYLFLSIIVLAITWCIEHLVWLFM